MKRKTSTRPRLRFFFRIFIDLRDAFMRPAERTERAGQRILILNWRDTRHMYSGGAEVYIHELAKRWVGEGHHVTLFCGSDGKSRRNETVDGVRIIRRGGFYFVYIWAFLYYLLQFRGNYDLIIDCENGIPFFTPLYAREKIFLLIHHVHQEVFLTSLKWPFSHLARFLEMTLMPLVYRKTQIITVSESSRHEIIEHGLTESDPIIIYNGIDHDAYQPGRPARFPLIVYVGRLKKYKNLPVLIHSFARINRALPQARLVIGGSGEELRSLKRLVKKLGLTETITFTGKLTEQEKIQLYQKAWVFVNPSLREGWGITSIEANACGTPVVASDVPGLRDSVRNPHTGFLVRYGDANAFAEKILQLLTDPRLRKRLRQGALSWANRFSWEYSAKQFLHVMTAPADTEAVPSPKFPSLRTSGVSYGKAKKYGK
jgi:glycosyltransferase involved in cell wall biosynthesis